MLRPPTAARVPRGTILVGAISLLSVTFPTAAVRGQIRIGRPAQRAEAEQTDVFRRAPRDLRQPLLRAKDAIDEQRYTDAARELGHLLASDVIGDSDAQDFFLPGTGEDGKLVQLRSEALRMLGEMPAEGREWYELEFGALARAALNEAIEAGDEEKMSEVVRKYFHTSAGHDAAMIVGRYQLAQGRPLAAALTLKRLSESPRSAAYDPELSLSLATAWVYTHRPEDARSVLLDLKRRNRADAIEIGGDRIRLFAEEEDALVWLDRTIGGRTDLRRPLASQWVLHRGGEDRNGEVAGSMPLLNYRWELPVANDPGDEAIVKKLAKEYLSQRVPAMPSLHPLVVQDIVLMRTTECLMGVDFETGKRVWTYPWGDEEPVAGDELSRSPDGNNTLRTRDLQQRLWDDAPYGQLSSDGDSVYLIEELGFALSQQRNNLVVFRGALRANPGLPKSHNVLVALDVRAEGKLRFLVGGVGGEDEPKLAGVFFLGPPLPVDGKLYVLAEVNGEIRLVTLDAETGSLLWFQQLAHVDNLHILVDPNRRLAGASPSFAGGVMVCPTSAGAVVAVDLARRSLLWGYAYERSLKSAAQHNISSLVVPRWTELGQRWTDATATIADGRVLLTPVESDQLHCLDLLSGEKLWTVPREQMLYVAGVRDGKIVMVGKHAVNALSLDTGKPVWPEEVDLKGDMPSGRGFLSGGEFFLGTTGSELLRIDVDDGKVSSRVPAMRPLGNLICYKDQVISQGTDYLAAYYQTEPLRKRVEEMLVERPDDAEALALHGELLLHDGRRAEAVTTLKKAYDKDPDNDTTRSLLVRTFLAALRDDFRGHHDSAAAIEPLIDRPEQLSEYLHLMASGYQELGVFDKAFAAYLKLASQRALGPGTPAAEEFLEQVERDRAVRRDRWVRARFAELLAGADQEARRNMDEEIRRRLAEMQEDESIPQLRQFIGYFGHHEIADRARLRLAARLTSAGELLEAELTLAPLVESRDEEIGGAATARLAEMLAAARRPDEAIDYYRRLLRRYGDVECADGRTGRELYENAMADTVLAALEQQPGGWPTGRIEVTEGGERVNNSPTYHRIYPIRIRAVSGPLSPGTRVALDHHRFTLIVRDPLGETDLRIPLPRSESRSYYSGNFHLAHGKISGHLLVLSIGFELIAVDMLRAKQNVKEAIVWRVDLSDSLTEVTPARLRVNSRAVSSPWGTSHYVPTTTEGWLVGELGPIHRTGVCYQKRREIVCVDPLNGAAVWSRDDVPEGSRLFGDSSRIFVIPAEGNKANKQRMLVLDPVDGRLLKEIDIDRSYSVWSTDDGRILSWKQVDKTLRLRLTDAWSGEVIWEHEFPYGSKGTLVEGDEVAVMTPQGRFVVLSLKQAEPRLDVAVESEPLLRDIEVLRDARNYFLVAQRPMSSVQGVSVQAVPSTVVSRIASARVYAFDRESGRFRWPSPAVVENFSFPPDQPPEAPVLTFLRHVARADSSNGRSSRRQSTSALCIDKRDGRVAFWDDSIEVSTHIYEVVAQPRDRRVLLILPNKTFTLQYTDEPTPPAPPARLGALTRPKSFSETAGRIANGILEAVRRAAPHQVLKVPFPPQAPPRQIPPPQPIAPPGPTKKNDDKAADTEAAEKPSSSPADRSPQRPTDDSKETPE